MSRCHSPFRFPIQTAAAETQSGTLHIRSAPSPSAPVVGTARDGARLTVLARRGGWFAVRHGRTCGYVSGDDIVLNY